MSEIPLNKFEKEKMVIERHKQGKTIRQIAPEVHKSFTDISRIIKAYERKLELETKKQDSLTNNDNQVNKTKKLSKSSQAYDLFHKGKTPVEVAIEQDLEFQRIRKYWTEFLRLKNMTKLYNIYIENEFHLDSLFRIYYFILRNNMSIGDIENVLAVAYDITKLYETHSNLKAEIQKMQQQIRKNNYIAYQNTSFQRIPPIQPLPRYPSSWNGYYYYY